MTPPIKHPWAAWLDGNDKTLVAGEDFPAGTNLRNLATYIRQRASDDGVMLSIRRPRGGNELQLVFGDGDRLVGRYPWDTWLDGQQHAIGFDEIGCQPESFRRYAWSMARQADKKVTVTIKTRQRLIGIQATGAYRPTRSVASASPTDEQLRQLNARPAEPGPAPTIVDFGPADFDSYRPLPARTSSEFGAAPAVDAEQDEPWPDDVDDLVTAERPS